MEKDATIFVKVMYLPRELLRLMGLALHQVACKDLPPQESSLYDMKIAYHRQAL